MSESLSPWRCLCADTFVCHIILLAPSRERAWSCEIRNPGMQYLAIAKTADTSTCIDGNLTQQRRPTQREDRKQYTWHDDNRICGCIQWQMQRCAVEEAETIVNQRNATSFKHDVLHSVCQCKSVDMVLKEAKSFFGLWEHIHIVVSAKCIQAMGFSWHSTEELADWLTDATKIWVMGQCFCSDVFQFCCKTLLSIYTRDITLL